MKITKQALKRIIKEEVQKTLREYGPTPEDPAYARSAARYREKYGAVDDETGGENKVYVLDRGRDYEGRTVVGVYSSEELAKKGIESDIEAWRASGRMAQPPKPGEYDIQDFELDD